MKEKITFALVWVGVALVSTAIVFVFIIGFKEVLGL